MLNFYEIFNIRKIFSSFITLLITDQDVTEDESDHVINCKDDKLPNQGQVCRFSDEWLQGGNCHKAEKWGYNKESPCVIIKLNKVHNSYIF